MSRILYPVECNLNLSPYIFKCKFLWLLSVHWILIRLFKSNLASIKNKWISTGRIHEEVNCTCNNGYVFSNSLKMCWMKENEWRIKNEHCPLGEPLYECRIKCFEFFSHLYNWQCDSREVTWTLRVFSWVFLLCPVKTNWTTIWDSLNSKISWNKII